MPTYEYACTDCGEHLEVVQAFADAPLAECPACQGTLRKVFAPIGVVFKGSGFYKTDSRTTSRSAGSDSAGKDSAASTGGSDTPKDAGTPKETTGAAGSGPGESAGSSSSSGSGAPSSPSTGAGKSGANGSGNTSKAAAS